MAQFLFFGKKLQSKIMYSGFHSTIGSNCTHCLNLAFLRELCVASNRSNSRLIFSPIGEDYAAGVKQQQGLKNAPSGSLYAVKVGTEL